jgi:hypothetical protein
MRSRPCQDLKTSTRFNQSLGIVQSSRVDENNLLRFRRRVEEVAGTVSSFI